jgi:DASH complex subunit SPC19
MASALEGCVASLRASMQNLDSTINILDDGVSDMPRLAKVLQTTRVRTTHGQKSRCDMVC